VYVKELFVLVLVVVVVVSNLVFFEFEYCGKLAAECFKVDVDMDMGAGPAPVVVFVVVPYMRM
jgi:hypothetical protein